MIFEMTNDPVDPAATPGEPETEAPAADPGTPETPSDTPETPGEPTL